MLILVGILLSDEGSLLLGTAQLDGFVLLGGVPVHVASFAVVFRGSGVSDGGEDDHDHKRMKPTPEHRSHPMESADRSRTKCPSATCRHPRKDSSRSHGAATPESRGGWARDRRGGLRAFIEQVEEIL